MEKKQTAIEWFDRWFRDNPEATHEEGNKALQQAKEMEKEQIEESFKAGWMRANALNYQDSYYKYFYKDKYGE